MTVRSACGRNIFCSVHYGPAVRWCHTFLDVAQETNSHTTGLKSTVQQKANCFGIDGIGAFIFLVVIAGRERQKNS